MNAPLPPEPLSIRIHRITKEEGQHVASFENLRAAVRFVAEFSGTGTEVEISNRDIVLYRGHNKSGESYEDSVARITEACLKSFSDVLQRYRHGVDIYSAGGPPSQSPKS